MKLELNVNRFANEDVIATSAGQTQYTGTMGGSKVGTEYQPQFKINGSYPATANTVTVKNGTKYYVYNNFGRLSTDGTSIFGITDSSEYTEFKNDNTGVYHLDGNNYYYCAECTDALK